MGKHWLTKENSLVSCRCSDAILSLQEYTYSDRNPAITIEELKGENKLEIKELYDKLTNHLAQKLSGS